MNFMTGYVPGRALGFWMDLNFFSELDPKIPVAINIRNASSPRNEDGRGIFSSFCNKSRKIRIWCRNSAQ